VDKVEELQGIQMEEENQGMKGVDDRRISRYGQW